MRLSVRRGSDVKLFVVHCQGHAEISFCALWLACACLCLGSVKVMPRKEGKPFTIAFVNFADGTLLGKCRDVLKILDETVPSWNAGVKISVAERSEEGGKVSCVFVVPLSSLLFR